MNYINNPANLQTRYVVPVMLLAQQLMLAGVPFRHRQIWEGSQLLFPWANDADGACHKGTYGCTEGKIETMGFSWDDDDVSVHMPDELAKLIIEEYQKALASDDSAGW